MTKIWQKPLTPVHQILAEIEDDIKTPPEEVEINIKLTGRGAKRLYFITRILQSAFAETPEEIFKYLITSGVEQEIHKIAAATNIVENQDEE